MLHSIDVYLYDRESNRMDGLRFYVLFNSISVISGRYEDDHEWLFATETLLR